MKGRDVHILYLTTGKGKYGERIDFRWRYTDSRGFVIANGPCNFRSFIRAVKWFALRRRRCGYPVVKFSEKHKEPK